MATAVQAEPLTEARALLGQGQAVEAAALLQPELLRHAGEPEYDYLLGSALYQAGREGEAQFALERVVMVAPEHSGALLLLARIAHASGDDAQAQLLLEQLGRQPLAIDTQAEVDRLLASVGEARSATRSRGYVMGGLGWDGNITSGPNADQLLVPVLGPTALGSASEEESVVASLEAGLELSHPLSERWQMSAAGSVRRNLFTERHDLDEDIANLQLGVNRSYGAAQLGVTALAQGYRVDSELYRRAFGGRVHWFQPLEGGDSLTLYGLYVDYRYPQHPIDDADRGVVGLEHQLALAGAWRWSYGLYLGREVAQDGGHKHFSFDLAGGSLGLQAPLNDDLTVAAGLIAETRNHRAEDKLYLTDRRDLQWSLGLAAEYRLAPAWSLLPQLTYTRNQSTLQLYDYTRSAFMLHLRWEFDR